MNIVGKTDKGVVRTSNQDAFEFGMLTDNTSWVIVCDGMGGANGGTVASSNAVKIIAEYIQSSYQESMSLNSIKALLQSSVYGANVRLYDMSNKIESLNGMGTTVVALVISNDVAQIVHVGDSRAYLFRDGKLVQLTKDHSIVQSMVDSGEITPEEALIHPNKNVITRALGVKDEVDIEYNEIGFLPKQKLLICTDGLTNYVPVNEIEEILNNNPTQNCADLLVELANKNGGGDNITVVVVDNWFLLLLKNGWRING